MKKTFVAIAAVCLFSAAAQAAPITATASVALVGVTAIPPLTVIDFGTTFNFSSSIWSGGTGDLSGVVPGSALTTASVTATLGQPASLISAWGAFNGVITNVQSVGDVNNRTVSFYALGDFAPTFGGFTDGPMSMTFSATQTGGPNAAISASYTIASPPATVPLPSTLALVGLAIAGLGLAASRRA